MQTRNKRFSKACLACSLRFIRRVAPGRSTLLASTPAASASPERYPIVPRATCDASACSQLLSTRVPSRSHNKALIIAAWMGVEHKPRHSPTLLDKMTDRLQQLTDDFAIPGILAFAEHDGLLRVEVTAPSAAATVHLQGAHITHWQPAGQAPVLFLSTQSEFADGKPIRGGIPICFPWFGPRSDGQAGPPHGFARIEAWELAFAAFLPGSPDAVTLSFVLSPSHLSRSLGFDHFRAEYRVTISTTLTLALTVANLAPEPLCFEEALHTYFAVADIRATSISGLESAPYLDKTDGMQQKIAPASPLTFTAQTDSVFPGATGPETIHDPGNRRQIVNTKGNSATTIVWNPWDKLASTVADLGAANWQGFCCVETANARESAITLNTGETHTMTATFSLIPKP